MIKEQMMEIMRAAYSGSMRESHLQHCLSSVNGRHRYYDCPCGGGDHYARSTPPTRDEPAIVVHCYEHRKMWMMLIPLSNPEYVASVIRGEEERFLKLLDTAPKQVEKWMRKNNLTKEELTGTHLSVLHHTFGFCPEVIESVTGDLTREQHEDYRVAFEEHKETGRK